MASFVKGERNREKPFSKWKGFQMSEFNRQERAEEAHGGQEPGLFLHMDPKSSMSFLRVLAKRFKLKVRNGLSIQEMLTEQYGLTPDYIDDRIKCVFLNGAPGDDLSQLTLEDGSTLALCDAIGGLAGCTMRRDTPHLRTMRSVSAHELKRKGVTEGQGMIDVKLFNRMVRELGPVFLEKGIWIGAAELEAFLNGFPRDFWRECRSVEVNGQRKEKDALLQMQWTGASDLVFIRVSLQS
jgi:hypothetical protein